MPDYYTLTLTDLLVTFLSQLQNGLSMSFVYTYNTCVANSMG